MIRRKSKKHKPPALPPSPPPRPHVLTVPADLQLRAQRLDLRFEAGRQKYPGYMHVMVQAPLEGPRCTPLELPDDVRLDTTRGSLVWKDADAGICGPRIRPGYATVHYLRQDVRHDWNLREAEQEFYGLAGEAGQLLAEAQPAAAKLCDPVARWLLWLQETIKPCPEAWDDGCRMYLYPGYPGWSFVVIDDVFASSAEACAVLRLSQGAETNPGAKQQSQFATLLDVTPTGIIYRGVCVRLAHKPRVVLQHLLHRCRWHEATAQDLMKAGWDDDKLATVENLADAIYKANLAIKRVMPQVGEEPRNLICGHGKWPDLAYKIVWEILPESSDRRAVDD